MAIQATNGVPSQVVQPAVTKPKDYSYNTQTNMGPNLGNAFGVDWSQIKAPTLDQGYNDMVSAVQKNADQFRANKGDQQSKLYGIQADQGRTALAKSLTGADQQANRRGLLYGGARQGLRSQAESGAAGALSQQRGQINDQINQQSQDLDTAALQAGLQRRADLQSLYNQDYNEKMAKNAGDQAQKSSLVGLGGMLAAGALI